MRLDKVITARCTNTHTHTHCTALPQNYIHTLVKENYISTQYSAVIYMCQEARSEGTACELSSQRRHEGKRCEMFTACWPSDLGRVLNRSSDSLLPAVHTCMHVCCPTALRRFGSSTLPLSLRTDGQVKETRRRNSYFNITDQICKLESEHLLFLMRFKSGKHTVLTWNEWRLTVIVAVLLTHAQWINDGVTAIWDTYLMISVYFGT